MKILSFGEILWDIFPTENFIGGAPLNFAAHSAFHHNDVFMLSAVGDDDLGKKALEQIKTWGISEKHIHISDKYETGKCIVTLDEMGIPNYKLLENTAYDFIPQSIKNEHFDALYFGTLALRSCYNYDSLKNLIANNIFREIFVDVNIRPPFYSKESVIFALETASILKISLEELDIVAEISNSKEVKDYREFAEVLSNKYRNLKVIIITLGAEGSFALDCKTQIGHFEKSIPVSVVSTVGAGDSFSAAFLSNFMQLKDITFCLAHANKIASYVVSHKGAVPK